MQYEAELIRQVGETIPVHVGISVSQDGGGQSRDRGESGTAHVPWMPLACLHDEGSAARILHSAVDSRKNEWMPYPHTCILDEHEAMNLSIS